MGLTGGHPGLGTEIETRIAQALEQFPRREIRPITAPVGEFVERNIGGEKEFVRAEP